MTIDTLTIKVIVFYWYNIKETSIPSSITRERGKIKCKKLKTRDREFLFIVYELKTHHNLGEGKGVSKSILKIPHVHHPWL